MSNDRINELIRRFNEINGNGKYSQKDLLKYIIGKLDNLNDKIDETNGKLDNHVNTISQRITAIETLISNIKWLFGPGIAFAIIIAVVSLYTKVI